MGARELRIATGFYDRVRAIADGRVPVADALVRYEFAAAEQLFAAAIQRAAYDVCELSLSYYITATAAGTTPYVAVPVFLSRVFRHSGIYVHGGAGIARPEDLRGKRIGVPDYPMTGAVWQRGFLADAHGVRPADASWLTGGLDRPAGAPLLPFQPPASLDIAPIGPERSLSDMLRAGEIDALLSSRVPRCVREGDPAVARLFPHYREVEQRYFRETGLYPIMHVVVMRRELARTWPGLGAALCEAFEAAKAAAVAELEELSALTTLLPWGAAALDDARGVLGADLHPYGLQANRRTLETMLRYMHEQELIATTLSVDELFAV